MINVRRVESCSMSKQAEIKEEKCKHEFQITYDDELIECQKCYKHWRET